MVLRWILKPVSIVYTLIKLLIVCKGNFKLFNRVFSRYLVRIAMAHDQADNTVVRFLFNDLLLKKDNSYKFGNMDEKISSVLGKNQRQKSLNGLGRFVNSMLHVLEEDHSLNSIDENVTDENLPPIN